MASWVITGRVIVNIIAFLTIALTVFIFVKSSGYEKRLKVFITGLGIVMLEPLFLAIGELTAIKTVTSIAHLFALVGSIILAASLFMLTREMKQIISQIEHMI